MSKNAITIYDVAKASGVSIATVNRALYNKPRVSEDTKKRIIKIAAEMGYTANKAAQALSRNPITIGILLSLSIPEVFSDMLDGIMKALGSLSALNVHGEIITVKSAQNTPEEEFVDAYKTLLNKGSKGIAILSGNKISGLRNIINTARNNNILTATIVTDIPDSQRVLSVRSNGICQGEMAAEFLSMVSPGGTFAVFASERNIPICAENLQGFASGCKKFGIKMGKVFENHDEPLIAYKAVDDLVNNCPETDGLYICSANSDTACQRLKELGLEKRYKIIATDLFEGVSNNIRSGLINATLFQNLQKQGELVIKTLYKKLTGEITAEKQEILLVPELILESNIEWVLKRTAEEMQTEERWKYV